MGLKEEIENKKLDSKIMMTEMVGMVNSIVLCIKFIGYLQEYQMCPVLVFQTWVVKTNEESKQWCEKCELFHMFYEKPCSSKLVIEQQSAMPHRRRL